MTKLAIEYGEGLYALGREEGICDRLLEELDALLSCLNEQPEFTRVLCNLSIGKEERLSVLDESFRGRVHPYLLSFMKILCERGAFRELSGCAEAFRSLYYEENRISEAVVTTAAPLTEDQRRRLIERLEQKSGHRIVLIEKTDASQLGGVLLELDGKRMDGTLRHRLNAMQELLAGNA